jgi:hypothetical protein
LINIREFFTNYKKGYNQAVVVMNGFALLLQLYTAIRVSVGQQVPTLLLIAAIGVMAVAGVLTVNRFGNWDYTSKKSLFKKDVEIEIKNHPYHQDTVRFNLMMAEAHGLDASFLEKWCNNKEGEQ